MTGSDPPTDWPAEKRRFAARPPEESPGLAVRLSLQDREVLVVGVGAPALGAIVTLVEAGARVTAVGTGPVAAIVDLSARGAIHIVDVPPPGGELARFWLVVAASGDPETDRAAAQSAHAVGRFCLSDRLDDVPIDPAAPSASGPDAGLTGPIRDVDERATPGGVVVEESAPSAGAANPRSSPTPSVGRVVLVGGGPGDPGLLTVAGRDAVRAADVLLVDRLAPLAVLAETRAGAEVIDVSKIPRGRFTPQEEINRLLVERAAAGRNVVRLKGGDSFVFGRGGEEWAACAAAGIPVTVIPGVSASLAAPALAGIPVTHRTMTQGFTVVSGHVPPGDPASTLDWSALARSGTTLILLMAVKNLPAITAELLADGLAPDTPAATVADAGSSRQRAVRSDLSGIAAATADAGIGAPAVTVIGAVAGFDPYAAT